MYVLFGFVTQNAAGVISSLIEDELVLTKTARLFLNTFPISTPEKLNKSMIILRNKHPNLFNIYTPSSKK